MKTFVSLIVTFVILSLNSFILNHQTNKPMIVVKVKVLEYIPNAFHDQMEDGIFAAFDGTKIQVKTPEEYKNILLTVLHQEKPGDSSLWRKPEAEIQFKINPDQIVDGQLVFKAALSEVN